MQKNTIFEILAVFWFSFPIFKLSLFSEKFNSAQFAIKMLGVFKILPIFVFGAVVVGLVESELLTPNYSVCSDHFVGTCENGLASDATVFDKRVTGVSVIGL